MTGGTLRGRRLAAPRAGVRPTADRVREALFARLPELEGALVLDLYAGTGALGIEAISRGAREVVFVERGGAGAAALRRNLGRLGVEGRSRMMRADVRDALRRLAREAKRFDLVLADPPYAEPRVAEVLALLAEKALLVPEGTLVVERSRRHPLPAVPGLAAVESRRYGDTVLSWLAPDASGAGPGAGPGASSGASSERAPEGLGGLEALEDDGEADT